MGKRLPRNVIYLVCAAVLGLLLACGASGDDLPKTYQICNADRTVCRTEYLTHQGCMQRYSRDVCG